MKESQTFFRFRSCDIQRRKYSDDPVLGENLELHIRDLTTLIAEHL